MEDILSWQIWWQDGSREVDLGKNLIDTFLAGRMRAQQYLGEQTHDGYISGVMERAVAWGYHLPSWWKELPQQHWTPKNFYKALSCAGVITVSVLRNAPPKGGWEPYELV